MAMRRVTPLASLLVAMIAFACGGGSKSARNTQSPAAGTPDVHLVISPVSGTPAPQPTYDHIQLTITGSGFQPNEIDLKQGSYTQIDVLNSDAVGHTVTVYGDETGTRAVVKSGTIAAGKHGTLTIPNPPAGRFAFADSSFAALKGVIVVAP